MSEDARRADAAGLLRRLVAALRRLLRPRRARHEVAPAPTGVAALVGHESAEVFRANGGRESQVVSSMDALEDASFDLLVLTDVADVAEAAKLCERRRALLLLDPPSGGGVDAVLAWADELPRSANAAAFFPRVSAAVAGLLSANDREHGVWAAPRGDDAVLVGMPDPGALGDRDLERLAEAGVNAVRLDAQGRPHLGTARTLSSDPEWRYVNLRRFFLYLERSIDEGTRWVAFEPNDGRTWREVRAAVDRFLHGLWRRGALLGERAEDAYFVRCDSTTMTQDDLDSGRLVVVVGVAPLRPAEFVTFRIEHLLQPAG